MTQTKASILILLVFALTSNLWGQREVPDSQVRIEGIDFILSTGHSLQLTLPDSSLFLGHQAKQLSQKLEYRKGIANANLLIGTSYLLKEQLDSATFYVGKAIRQAEAYKLEKIQEELQYFKDCDGNSISTCCDHFKTQIICYDPSNSTFKDLMLKKKSMEERVKDKYKSIDNLIVKTY